MIPRSHKDTQENRMPDCFQGIGGESGTVNRTALLFLVPHAISAVERQIYVTLKISRCQKTLGLTDDANV